MIPTSTATPTLAVALLLVIGCSDPGQDGGGIDAGTAPHHCPAGLKPMGPTCVPVFDACQDDEVPVQGGGCKRVGVRQCLDGWGIAGPPDWTCKPIGPPRTCLPGWAMTQTGWCEPVLPTAPCPAGTMEVIGQAACQPTGDCGTGTWGKIKTTAKTIFVDQSYAGGGSDGTQAKPYPSINAAMAQTAAGDHIAVAAGTYKESVSITRAVTVEGRCAQMVTITKGSGYAAVEIRSWASGAMLRGVTVNGAGVGVRVDGVAATVEQAAIQGCEGFGIEVESGGTLTLRHSLVAGNRAVGILVKSSQATVDRTVVRDTRGQASDKKFGTGIEASVQPSLSQGTVLVLRDSLVAGNRARGILLGSSQATVERSVVRGTREQASDNRLGEGIEASVHPGHSRHSELVLRDCLVAGNRNTGISVNSSRATVVRSVVRDTREQASNNWFGTGIQALVQSGQSRGAELVLRDSLMVGNHYIGISVASSKATVERSVVRDTREQASDNRFGTGIQALVQSGQSQGAELVIRHSLVAGNRAVGIAVWSSQATVDCTVVRNTREQASDMKGGTGIQASFQLGRSQGSELVLRDSLVAGNRTEGIAVFSSRATVERSVVRDTREQASDNRFGAGIQASAQSGLSQGSELVLRDSLVAGNRNTGIGVNSSRATVERSVVRDTRMNGKGLYGDGVGVGDNSTLEVRDTTVEQNARAGLLFVSSGGSVQGCLVRQNIFAIDLEKGSNPTIGAKNQMVDNQINEVSSGQGLEPAPIASLPGLP